MILRRTKRSLRKGQMLFKPGQDDKLEIVAVKTTRCPHCAGSGRFQQLKVTPIPVDPDPNTRMVITFGRHELANVGYELGKRRIRPSKRRPKPLGVQRLAKLLTERTGL